MIPTNAMEMIEHASYHNNALFKKVQDKLSKETYKKISMWEMKEFVGHHKTFESFANSVLGFNELASTSTKTNDMLKFAQESTEMAELQQRYVTAKLNTDHERYKIMLGETVVKCPHCTLYNASHNKKCSLCRGELQQIEQEHKYSEKQQLRQEQLQQEQLQQEQELRQKQQLQQKQLEQELLLERQEQEQLQKQLQQELLLEQQEQLQQEQIEQLLLKQQVEQKQKQIEQLLLKQQVEQKQKQEQLLLEQQIEQLQKQLQKQKLLKN
jgi:hypothetical protein